MIKGYVASLLSAIFYGSGHVMTKWAVSGSTPPIVGATISLFCGVIVLYLVGWKDFSFGFEKSRKALLFVLAAGALAAAGVVMLYQALFIAGVAIVSPFAGTTPIFTMLGSYVFLKKIERISFGLLVGCVLVTVGSVLVTVG